MKKTAFLLALVLTACGSGSDEFRLRGEISGMEQTDLLIYNLDGDDPRIDTIHVVEGRFAYAGHQYEPTPYILVFPNAVEQVIFASARANLEYEATASDLRGYTVKGTKENEVMNQFRQDTHDTNPVETRDIAQRYIRRHAASPVALYLFERYFVQDTEADFTATAQLCTLLEQHHPTSALLLTLKKALADRQRGMPGQIAADVPDSLLYFWATWQPSAWTNMGNLRSAIRRYDSRRLCSVTISLDATDVNWVTYVNPPDTLALRHLYDGLSWDTPLARTFNIRRLPTYILLDRQKRIVSRFEKTDQLEKELEKRVK